MADAFKLPCETRCGAQVLCQFPVNGTPEEKQAFILRHPSRYGQSARSRAADAHLAREQAERNGTLMTTPEMQAVRSAGELRCRGCGHEARRHYPMPGCIEAGTTLTKWGTICACRWTGTDDRVEAAASHD